MEWSSCNNCIDPRTVASRDSKQTCCHIRLNTISSDLTSGSLTRSFSELDLAVLKHNVQSARILVRSGGVSKHTSGDLGADELLFRVLLLGMA